MELPTYLYFCNIVLENVRVIKFRYLWIFSSQKKRLTYLNYLWKCTFSWFFVVNFEVFPLFVFFSSRIIVKLITYFSFLHICQTPPSLNRDEIYKSEINVLSQMYVWSGHFVRTWYRNIVLLKMQTIKVINANLFIRSFFNLATKS